MSETSKKLDAIGWVKEHGLSVKGTQPERGWASHQYNLNMRSAKELAAGSPQKGFKALKCWPVARHSRQDEMDAYRAIWSEYNATALPSLFNVRT